MKSFEMTAQTEGGNFSYREGEAQNSSDPSVAKVDSKDRKSHVIYQKHDRIMTQK